MGHFYPLKCPRSRGSVGVVCAGSAEPLGVSIPRKFAQFADLILCIKSQNTQFHTKNSPKFCPEGGYAPSQFLFSQTLPLVKLHHECTPAAKIRATPTATSRQKMPHYLVRQLKLSGEFSINENRAKLCVNALIDITTRSKAQMRLTVKIGIARIDILLLPDLRFETVCSIQFEKSANHNLGLFTQAFCDRTLQAETYFSTICCKLMHNDYCMLDPPTKTWSCRLFVPRNNNIAYVMTCDFLL